MYEYEYVYTHLFTQTQLEILTENFLLFDCIVFALKKYIAQYDQA